jgi:hypothetical protein
MEIPKGEEAMELFKLIRASNLLPSKPEELKPLIFIGQAAMQFYGSVIKSFKGLPEFEAQHRATLKDGQDAGEMLLDLEVKFGEAALKEPQIQGKFIKEKGESAFRGAVPSGTPPKHERLGLPEKRMRQYETLAKHPEVVAKIKAQARENEDLPSRTAALNAISYEKEKTRQKEVDARRGKEQETYPEDQLLYIMALDKCIHALPQKPPADWNQKAFKEAEVKARILIKRLSVFNP